MVSALVGTRQAVFVRLNQQVAVASHELDTGLVHLPSLSSPKPRKNGHSLEQGSLLGWPKCSPPRSPTVVYIICSARHLASE